MRRFSLILARFAVVGVAFATFAAAGARAQSIVAIVNGAPISSMDVASRAALMQLTGQKVEQRVVVEALIEERLKMLEARRVGLLPSDDEVDQAFAGIGKNMNLSPDQFTKALASRGVQAATLKSRLRAELGWNRFVREKFRATSPIQDQDVVAALSNKTEKEKEEAEKSETYKLASVVFVLPKNAPAARVSQRLAEANALRARFKSCDEGFATAKGLRDVAVRPLISRSTASMSPRVREVLDKTPLGTLTPPEQSEDGIELFAICDKKEESGNMVMQAKVREELTSEGMQVQARKYINELRARAVIEYR